MKRTATKSLRCAGNNTRPLSPRDWLYGKQGQKVFEREDPRPAAHVDGSIPDKPIRLSLRNPLSTPMFEVVLFSLMEGFSVYG